MDQSAELLADLLERMRSWGTSRGYDVEIDGNACKLRGPRLDCHVETLQLDIGVLNDRVLFSGRHLVTASALLDLVSESWLRGLAAHCRAEGASALFTISYNGRSSCEPREPEDDLVLDLFNRHQRTDKGLGGPAAGPEAAETAARCFAETGFHVHRVPSDWTLAPSEQDMQRLLIDGWANAATETAPATSANDCRLARSTTCARRRWHLARHRRPRRPRSMAPAHLIAMTHFDADDIRAYYDRHTAGFLTHGQGGDVGAIHRAVWGPGTTTRAKAFHYVEDLIAALVTSLPDHSSPRHLVDLGCGVGASLCYLAERLPIRGTGVTLSPVQCAHRQDAHP